MSSVISVLLGGSSLSCPLELRSEAVCTSADENLWGPWCLAWVALFACANFCKVGTLNREVFTVMYGWRRYSVTVTTCVGMARGVTVGERGTVLGRKY